MKPESGYEEIMASPSIGTRIGQLYMEASPAITPGARMAYLLFVDEIRQQFAEMVADGLKVHFQDEDPYADAYEMFADVKRGRLAVYKTQPDQQHPLMCPWDNNRFRAVHDFHGHFMTGRDFSRHGEEAAWVRHSRMFGPIARRAMTTETRGQSSAFIWINKGLEFPEQKGILLPEWVGQL